MDFSEFKRRLGAEPRSGDPELTTARDSSPEYREEAQKAEAFEEKLERALSLPVPDDLMDLISGVATARKTRRERWPLALAASLLIVAGAAGVSWKMNQGWASVEAYVMDHYRHDGAKEVAQALESPYGDVHRVLAQFGIDATPALADIVRVAKYCPTPGGKGVHMVLMTQSGPVTVIYMPDTPVNDSEMIAFDGMEAMLVDLATGSAAVIGTGEQQISDLYAVVHDSIVPLAGRS